MPHLNFVLAEEGVDPFGEGFLLDVETLVSQSPDSTFLEIEVVLVRLPVRGHLAADRNSNPECFQSVQTSRSQDL